MEFSTVMSVQRSNVERRRAGGAADPAIEWNSNIIYDFYAPTITGPTS